MNSCIYRGAVRHRRSEPASHAFTYPLFMMYLDLEELPTLFEHRWLWSAVRPAVAWFRRADYLGDPATDLGEAVRAEASRHTGRRPTGPIRMLTHLRYFGYVMNPVTFYYCFAPEGERVELILAEITNTPWGDRHVYVLGGGTPVPEACGGRHRFAKAFHVSPFMSMEHEYEWRFTEPGDRLLVHMKNEVGTERHFDATLLLHREEISGRSLSAALSRYPWMTARVATGIYWQAFRLWLKGFAYHERPQREAA